MPVPQVLNRIAVPVALPAPVPWPIAMWPHSKAIAAATPGTGASILAAMGGCHFLQRGVSANHVKEVHAFLSCIDVSHNDHNDDNHRSKFLLLLTKNDCHQWVCFPIPLATV
jgi:hypothetical protein